MSAEIPAETTNKGTGEIIEEILQYPQESLEDFLNKTPWSTEEFS